MEYQGNGYPAGDGRESIEIQLRRRMIPAMDVADAHGQGMNAAFEDCSAFVGLLDSVGPDTEWSDLFAEFESIRRANAEAIANMALENYVIMRDAMKKKSSTEMRIEKIDLQADLPQDIFSLEELTW